MSILTRSIRLDKEYNQLLQALTRDFRVNPLPILASGLCEGAADAFLVSLLEDSAAFRGGAALLLCPEEKDCVRLSAMLERYGLRTAFYMARDLTFYNITASHEYEHERLRVLSGLLADSYDVVLTTPDAALGYTVSPRLLSENLISIDATEPLETKEIALRLQNAGFVRVDMVDSPGQFALRGGIVDIYPPHGRFLDSDGGERITSCALRIELFGDEIDRMGIFDPETQRMTSDVVLASFTPARELLPSAEALDRLKKAISAQFRSAKDERACEELVKEGAAIDRAKRGEGEVCFLDKYITLVYPERACLLDYFRSGKRLVLMHGTNAVSDRLKAADWHLNQTVIELLESGTIAPKYAEYAKPASALELFCADNVTLHVDSIAYNVTDRRLAGLFGFRTRHTVSYSENESLFFEDLDNYIKGGYRCLVLTENEVEAKRIGEKLADRGFLTVSPPEDPAQLERGTVAVLYRDLLAGFELMAPRLAVLSTMPDARVGALTLSAKTSLRKKKKKTAQSILSYAELEVGDYVVHETYGIGQYTGIETLTCDGVTRDYIGIRYAGSDKLFLPTEKLDKVSKYIGAHADDGTVKLSKMGSDSWKKSKARAKAAVKDMAKDLIKLYAERMRRPGHAFPSDDSYQKAFEDAFEYDETESQLSAADEIKKDMMQAVPMDRLLCGDVGYGKTEVALRAAYKAVLGGKQVAILVPTTLLALQHYQTIVSRMRAFAVNVDMLSRFRTSKQQALTLRRLARGEVDIVVGTHRLLSKDVAFHDLGLVIVDEEQRFGVAQKEKLKQISGGVDVLSLSATPIPRTLNMAMGGIRDISILDDAPNDRLPVQTYVLEEDDLIIEEAIRREMRRGGQIFYLHNTVETINTLAAKLSAAIPEARITVAHGKMTRPNWKRSGSGCSWERSTFSSARRSSRPGWTFPTPTRSSSPTRTGWDFLSCTRSADASVAPRDVRMPTSPILPSAQSRRLRKKDSRRSANTPSSARASRSLCATWRSAVRVTFSVPSSTDIWMRSATIFISSCSIRRCWRKRERRQSPRPTARFP